MHQALADHRKLVNSLNLQSQIQKALQDYTSEMPILIEFQHFKTELCNPKYAALPLTVLRRLLDSFDFLKITQFIYDLSQFHLLVNRTYTQLIEQEEFLIVTLDDLFERGQRQTHRFPQANQRDKHLAIINRGIEAVNAYHDFADGLIRSWCL